MPENAEKLLTVTELAEKLAGSHKPRTLLVHARKGWIPGKRSGKKWLFRLSEVEAKMAENGTPK